MFTNAFHSLNLPYWLRPGLLLAVAASEDETGDDPELDEDEDEDGADDDGTDKDEDPDAGKSDEDLRAELKEIRKHLASSNDKGKRNRLRVKQLQSQLSQRATDGKGDKAEGDQPDVDAVRREVQDKANQTIKRVSVRAALSSAGLTKEQVGRMIALVDLGDLDVDEDGEVDGVDEAIEDLRNDFPQLFEAKAEKGAQGGRRKVRSAVGGNGVAKVEKSIGQIQAEALRG